MWLLFFKRNDFMIQHQHFLNKFLKLLLFLTVSVSILLYLPFSFGYMFSLKVWCCTFSEALGISAVCLFNHQMSLCAHCYLLYSTVYGFNSVNIKLLSVGLRPSFIRELDLGVVRALCDKTKQWQEISQDHMKINFYICIKSNSEGKKKPHYLESENLSTTNLNGM